MREDEKCRLSKEEVYIYKSKRAFLRKSITNEFTFYLQLLHWEDLVCGFNFFFLVF